MKPGFIAGLIVLANAVYAQTFTVKSNEIEGQAKNKEIYNRFGCEGEKVSPHFALDKCTVRNKKFHGYYV